MGNTLAMFHSLADDYAHYRPGLPDEAAVFLASLLDRLPAPTLLDLGAGTGQVAAALLPYVVRADLVDPDTGMLDQAQRLLSELPGGATVSVHPVRAEAFTAPHPGYQTDLITCSRAFHWMNRPTVLAMADRVAAPHAAVAIMGDGSLWTHLAEWTAALKGLIQSDLGEDRRAGTTGAYREPGRRYEDDLAASAFCSITEHHFPFARDWTPRGVLGYLRSTSFARPDLFADHTRFEEQAQALLQQHAQDGVLHEDGVFTVLLARRPRTSR